MKERKVAKIQPHKGTLTQKNLRGPDGRNSTGANGGNRGFPSHLSVLSVSSCSKRVLPRLTVSDNLQVTSRRRLNRRKRRSHHGASRRAGPDLLAVGRAGAAPRGTGSRFLAARSYHSKAFPTAQ